MPVAVANSEPLRVVNRLPVAFNTALPNAVGSYTLADLLIKSHLVCRRHGVAVSLRSRRLIDVEAMQLTLLTSKATLLDFGSSLSPVLAGSCILAAGENTNANWYIFLLIVEALYPMNLEKETVIPHALWKDPKTKEWLVATYKNEGGVHVLDFRLKEVRIDNCYWLALEPDLDGDNPNTRPDDGSAVSSDNKVINVGVVAPSGLNQLHLPNCI